MSAPRRLDDAQIRRIHELHQRGFSQRVIARDAKVTQRAIADVLHQRTHREPAS